DAHHRWRDDVDRRRRIRTAALLAGATLLVACINPYGLRVLALALGQGASLGNEVQKTMFLELRSPFSFGQRFTAVRFYEALIALAIATGVLAWGRMRAFWILLAASQLCLSATAIRNLPLFGLVAIPFIARGVVAAPLLQRARARSLESYAR